MNTCEHCHCAPADVELASVVAEKNDILCIEVTLACIDCAIDIHQADVAEHRAAI